MNANHGGSTANEESAGVRPAAQAAVDARRERWLDRMAKREAVKYAGAMGAPNVTGNRMERCLLGHGCEEAGAYARIVIEGQCGPVLKYAGIGENEDTCTDLWAGSFPDSVCEWYDVEAYCTFRRELTAADLAAYGITIMNPELGRIATGVELNDLTDATVQQMGAVLKALWTENAIMTFWRTEAELKADEKILLGRQSANEQNMH